MTAAMASNSCVPRLSEIPSVSKTSKSPSWTRVAYSSARLTGTPPERPRGGTMTCTGCPGSLCCGRVCRATPPSWARMTKAPLSPRFATFSSPLRRSSEATVAVLLPIGGPPGCRQRRWAHIDSRRFGCASKPARRPTMPPTSSATSLHLVIRSLANWAASTPVCRQLPRPLAIPTDAVVRVGDAMKKESSPQERGAAEPTPSAAIQRAALFSVRNAWWAAEAPPTLGGWTSPRRTAHTHVAKSATCAPRRGAIGRARGRLWDQKT
mmetsp:Transcript_99829/g.277802  ORF Transcript_99829/g.277802 Transcript_99829/m.277802 type:complete len:266 (+) Transcript_99829:487-1284(+)